MDLDFDTSTTQFRKNSWRYTNLKIESRFQERQILPFSGHQWLEQSDAAYDLHDFLTKLLDSLTQSKKKTEKETLENNFIAEFMVNTRWIHVFMNSSKKFMRCFLNPSFLL